MNPQSAAILTSVADDCKRHWDAGRFGRALNRHLSPRDVSIVRSDVEFGEVLRLIFDRITSLFAKR